MAEAQHEDVTQTIPAPEAGQAAGGVARWAIDPAHSEVGFSIRHLMISSVKGRFGAFRGHLDFDEARPTEAAVDVEIDVASVDTGSADRDAHLRSPEFFDADACPTIRFVSRRVQPLDEDHFKVVGDLTLHGVTREVVLDVCYEGSGTDPWGNRRAGFTANTKINRKDFGLTWNAALETGGVMVGEDVKITLDIQVIKQA